MESGLDKLDFQIIRQLQDDGRKPTAEIARALKVPRTTVARRLERLVAEKIIRIGAYAYGPRIGLPIQVMIEIWTDTGKHEAAIAAIMALDEVRWVGVASGPYDVLAEAMVRSNAHLRRLLLHKLGKIEGITQIRTANILEVVKISFEWERMLHAEAEAEPEDEGSVTHALPG